MTRTRRCSLIRGLPEVVPELSDRADQEFHLELRQGKNGMLWSKIHAPWRGPAFFAAFGLFALIEWTAHRGPYEEITVPGMAGIAGLTYYYFERL